MLTLLLPLVATAQTTSPPEQLPWPSVMTPTVVPIERAKWTPLYMTHYFNVDESGTFLFDHLYRYDLAAGRRLTYHLWHQRSTGQLCLLLGDWPPTNGGVLAHGRWKQCGILDVLSSDRNSMLIGYTTDDSMASGGGYGFFSGGFGSRSVGLRGREASERFGLGSITAEGNWAFSFDGKAVPITCPEGTWFTGWDTRGAIRSRRELLLLGKEHAYIKSFPADKQQTLEELPLPSAAKGYTAHDLLLLADGSVVLATLTQKEGGSWDQPTLYILSRSTKTWSTFPGVYIWAVSFSGKVLVVSGPNGDKLQVVRVSDSG